VAGGREGREGVIGGAGEGQAKGELTDAGHGLGEAAEVYFWLPMADRVTPWVS